MNERMNVWVIPWVAPLPLPQLTLPPLQIRNVGERRTNAQSDDTFQPGAAGGAVVGVGGGGAASRSLLSFDIPEHERWHIRRTTDAQCELTNAITISKT